MRHINTRMACIYKGHGKQIMRKITELNTGWRFLKHDMPVSAAMQYAPQGEAVVLPHTWNALDGQDGGNDYHRGTCWYVRVLSEEELAGVSDGRHVFLEFSGAAMTSEVYLNGEKLARHEGGYSAFRVDLTGKTSMTSGTKCNRILPATRSFQNHIFFLLMRKRIVHRMPMPVIFPNHSLHPQSTLKKSFTLPICPFHHSKAM